MFGIDDALIWMPLAGAVAGGLMNKKDPFKGALLGAGVGASGGLLAAPTAGAAGGLAAADAAAGLVPAAELGASGVSPVALSQMGFTGGNLASGTAGYAMNGLKTAGEMVKPMGNVVNTAAAAKNLMSSPETPLPQIQPSPVVTGQGGGQALAQLVTNNNQKNVQLQQDALQRKQRRMGLLGVA